ncbi:hypothetical protein M8C21_021871 [Ambrosia artemisiifolia]|uniref:Uncharacterized protein n=1 Tax=Ambrosia artemisiifolia TaxID=4212 RepID=A0AAD5CD34_AMBAR|nr:hypothetical protein M8C21_021871 [Ambrosia artemisiifolia]
MSYSGLIRGSFVTCSTWSYEKLSSQVLLMRELIKKARKHISDSPILDKPGKPLLPNSAIPIIILIVSCIKTVLQ